MGNGWDCGRQGDIDTGLVAVGVDGEWPRGVPCKPFMPLTCVEVTCVTTGRVE